MRQYADSTALAAYPGGSAVASDSVDLLLRTASRVVDKLLTGILYDTDSDGMPTDTDVAQALSDATCAIALEADARGSLNAGQTQQWESVQIGNVALSTLQGASATDTPMVLGLPVPPAAIVALSGVGPMGVWVQ